MFFIKKIVLGPEEYMITKKGDLKYSFLQPGVHFVLGILPWMTWRHIVKLSFVSSQEYYRYYNVHTYDGVALEIRVQIFYRPSLRILEADNRQIAEVVSLVKSDWQTPLRELTDFLLRSYVAKVYWKTLVDRTVASNMQTHLRHELACRLQSVFLDISEVRLMDVILPEKLQTSITLKESMDSLDVTGELRDDIFRKELGLEQPLLRSMFERDDEAHHG